MSTKVYKTPKKSNGSGSYGEYYVVNKKDRLGIKALFSYFRADSWKKMLEDELSQFILYGQFDERSDLADAAYECAAMALLQECDCVPDTYGMCWVKKGDRYTPGILMEHIPGVDLAEYNDLPHWADMSGSQKSKADELAFEIQDEMEYGLRKYGIDVNDWHAWNVLVWKMKEYRIDFGRHFFLVKPKFKKRFKEIVQEITLDLISNFPE